MLAKTKDGTEVMVRNAPVDMLAAFVQALTLERGTTTEIAIFRDSVPYGGLLLRGNRILAAYQPAANRAFEQRKMRAMLRDFLTLDPEHYTFMAWHNVEDTSHFVPIDTVTSALMACALPRELEGQAVDLAADSLDAPPTPAVEIVSSATSAELLTMAPTPPPVVVVQQPPQPPPPPVRPPTLQKRLRASVALLASATVGGAVHHAFSGVDGHTVGTALTIGFILLLATWVFS